MNIASILELVLRLTTTISSISVTLNKIVSIANKASAEGRDLTDSEVAAIQAMRKSSEDELARAVN